MLRSRSGACYHDCISIYRKLARQKFAASPWRMERSYAESIDNTHKEAIFAHVSGLLNLPIKPSELRKRFPQRFFLQTKNP